MAEKNDVICLERSTYREDALAQLVPDGTEVREIYCTLCRPTRTEWASAARLGLKSSYCAIVWADEYGGETTAVVDGVRYGIYRTYKPNSEEIELYLEQKVGV